MEHFSRSVVSSKAQITVNVCDQIAYHDVYVTGSQIQTIFCLCHNFEMYEPKCD